MGIINRCLLIGTPCPKQITVEEKTFFLAEAEKPDYDRDHRSEAMKIAIVDGYKIKSALEEKGINAFTCKICEMIQTCAYGIADISQNNANVFMELGIMLALGKPTIILNKKGQKKKLKLPSNLVGIEVIPFVEYLDIIDQLRESVKKLPQIPSTITPIQNLEKIQPQFAKELKKMEKNIVKEFKSSIKEANIDIFSYDKDNKNVSPELNEKLKALEGQLESMSKLGITMDAETASLKGQYLHYLGKYEEALSSFDLSLELNPNDPDILTYRAEIYMHLGKHKEALADCNRSLNLQPNNNETLDVRGSAFSMLGKHKKALLDYNRSLTIRPNDPTTLANRGGAYHELKMYKKALKDYNNSLNLKPDDPDTLVNRSNTYYELGMHKKALKDCNHALKLEPNHVDALYNLACFYALENKPDDAIKYLKKAISKDEECKEEAKTDKDFDNIRNEPSFKKLVGE
jgi:tetratricopeptide (TPR) repeat protein